MSNIVKEMGVLMGIDIDITDHDCNPESVKFYRDHGGDWYLIYLMDLVCIGIDGNMKVQSRKEQSQRVYAWHHSSRQTPKAAPVPLLSAACSSATVEAK